MDIKEIQELARAAAHAAVVAKGNVDEKHAVDRFLMAYEYALKKILEKQYQAQNDVNNNRGKFR